jgi:hypothetical protein
LQRLQHFIARAEHVALSFADFTVVLLLRQALWRLLFLLLLLPLLLLLLLRPTVEGCVFRSRHSSNSHHFGSHGAHM